MNIFAKKSNFPEILSFKFFYHVKLKVLYNMASKIFATKYQKAGKWHLVLCVGGHWTPCDLKVKCYILPSALPGSVGIKNCYGRYSGKWTFLDKKIRFHCVYQLRTGILFAFARIRPTL